MVDRFLTRDEIVAGLNCLDGLLAERNQIARIYIVGGAVMSLLYLRPPPGTTQDVDAILMETNAPLQQLIWEVASKLNYPLEWLNQGARGLPIHDEEEARQVLYESPNLVVAGASLEYMLALKTAAARDKDHYDFYVLCDRLGVKSMDQVMEAYYEVFPEEDLEKDKLDTLARWVKDFDTGPPPPPHESPSGQDPPSGR